MTILCPEASWPCACKLCQPCRMPMEETPALPPCSHGNGGEDAAREGAGSPLAPWGHHRSAIQMDTNKIKKQTRASPPPEIHLGCTKKNPPGCFPAPPPFPLLPFFREKWKCNQISLESAKRKSVLIKQKGNAKQLFEMEIVLNRHLFRKKEIQGCLSRRCRGAGLFLFTGSFSSADVVSLAQRVWDGERAVRDGLSRGRDGGCLLSEGTGLLLL